MLATPAPKVNVEILIALMPVAARLTFPAPTPKINESK